MTQSIDRSNIKFNSLAELKSSHAKTLLFHACQAQFRRDPTNHELLYWTDFLVNDGDLHEMLKRLPDGPGEVAIKAEPVASVYLPEANLVSEAAATATDPLNQDITPKSGAHQGVISLVGSAGLFYAGRPAKIYVLVENLSAITWVSGQVQPVFACYHWIDKTGNIIIYDGIRSRLPEAIEPAARKQVPVSVIAPPVAGDYILEVTLVHEGVTWMEDDGLTSLRFEINVDPSLSESGLKIMKELQWAKSSAVEKF
jgi:hypothetical protein